MVVLSARFALLACLCAAIPLVHPPPVEAAHLHDRYSSSSHPLHRTPSVPRAHGKHHGHKAPGHRAEQLPPLLRRHTVGDHKRVQNNHGGERHDNHPPRSVFSRNRPRRPSGPYSRRSSVYVPGEHGDKYMVSKSQRIQANARTGTGRRSSHTHNRRQLDESSLALGRIDIMGAVQQAGSTQRLASLIVDSTPIDWASGDGSTKAFQLNASTTNQTQFIMVPMNESPNAAAQGNFNKHVTLATEVFDANTAEMVMYCATYDPDPGSTSMLLMTPCMDDDDDGQSATPANAVVDPCSNADDDASSEDPHQSQIFSYDPSSGKIDPISAVANSNAVARCAGARVRRDNSNTVTSTSTTPPSSTSTRTAPTASASQQARNVTLVYVAGALELPASAQNASTTNGSGGQTPLFTTTITTTLVTTVTPGASSRTATLAQAAVSIPLSSTPTPSPSMTMTKPTPIPSGSATASRSLSSLSFSSSAVPTTVGKEPQGGDRTLEVEIVGVTPSTTSSSSSTSHTASTTTTTITTTTMTPSPSPSLSLAEVVASSLSNSMPHSRRRAFGQAPARNAC